MRWKTSSKTETKKVGDETKKITTVTKTQYITVGDIVGMGKSAAGAVQKLAKELPEFIEQLKNLPGEIKDTANNFKNTASETANGLKDAAISEGSQMANAAIAAGINAVVQPLAVMMGGMEKYKKIMGVIDTLTPIVKTIARSTGVWCSPGNVAELGKIALGVAQKMLIAILTSAILRLKEMIWNYEFDIKSISTETSITICELLKKYNEEHKDDKPNNNLFNGDSSSFNENNKGAYDTYEKRLKDFQNLIDQQYSEEYDDIGPEIGNIMDFIEGDGFTEEDKGKIDYNLNNYVTEEIIHDNIKRILYGSLDGTGIYYSDDDGETWTGTEQTTGSFANFAKIKVENDWVYIAGSTYTIKSVIPTIDTSISDCKDADNHYNKDYYDKDLNKYKKFQKDSIFGSYTYNEIKEKELLNDKNEYEDAVGILWSDDGIEWHNSNLTSGSYELFFEFQEKVGAPARTVASSYDYGGVYYTEDGKVWQHAKTIEGNEITKDRWVFYTDCDNELTNTLRAENIKSTAKIPKPLINTIASINIGDLKMNITEDINSYQGKEFAGIDVKLTGAIIEYIHFNYPTRIPKYDEEFWRTMIININNGTYTMEDAINGKGLEVEEESNNEK